MNKAVYQQELRAPWPHARSVRIDNPTAVIFCAGAVAFDHERKIAGKDDIRIQTRTALENLKTRLESAGCTFESVCDLVVYLTDVRDYPAVAEIGREYFGNSLPALTMIGVSALGLPEMKIEIKAIACK